MEDPAPDGWYADPVATFGDRLAAARVARGLSQEEVAAQLGVRQRTLRSWEDDQAEPRANRLQMLAGVLGVSLRWLMTGMGEGAPSGGSHSPDVTVILAELHDLRADMTRCADRLSRLEARLRSALSGVA
jgi:transcriptional regulator with XRE-family HTH domain